MDLLDRETIEALPQRYRINLINSIAGFKPALLVGTSDHQGHSNLAVFSSVFHIGASPALLGLIVRPDPEGTERHTLDNILETGAYTLNHVTAKTAIYAHQTSARYPRNTSEFTAAGFDELWCDGFAAPFVAGAAIGIGLALAEHQRLELNGTHLIIGSIEHIRVESELVREDGSVDLALADSTVVAGLDSYHSVTPGVRFSYAKADREPTEI